MRLAIHAALAVVFGLSACTKQDQTALKDVAANTATIADEKARVVGQQIDRGLDQAKVATENAASTMSAKIDDAVITTGVKAELAKDSALSALKIEVDTRLGQVALRGTAPSSDAKSHATELARGVRGVHGVDNQLTVAPNP